MEQHRMLEYLTKECTKYIKEQDTSLKSNFPNPQFPILFVEMGMNKEQREIIQQEIDALWPMGKKIISPLVLDNEEKVLDSYAEKENTVNKLKMESCFREYHHVWIVNMLEVSSDNFESYCAVLGEKQSNWWNVVIAFVSYKCKENQKRMEHLFEMQKEGQINGIIILGDYLYSGQLLSEEKKKDNYSMAVTAMGIMNSDNGENYAVGMREPGIYTLSQLVVRKPLEMIGEVLLYSLLENGMKYLQEYDAEQLKSRIVFFDYLTENGKKCAFGLEDIFKEEFAELFDMKEKNFEGGFPKEKVLAEKIWKLFKEDYFGQPVKSKLEDTQMRKRIKERCRQNFIQVIDYEILIYFWEKKGEQITDVVEELMIKQPEKQENKEYWLEGMDYAITSYMRIMRKICKEIIVEEYYKACKFKKLLKDCSEILRARAFSHPEMNDELFKNISSYYEEMSQDYIEHYFFRAGADIKNMLCTEEDEKEICRRILKCCKKLVEDNQKVFQRSFTEEIDARLVNMHISEKEDHITKALGRDTTFFDSKCRILSNNLPEGKEFCLVHPDAGFRDAMKKHFQNLIDSNRRDRVETIKIYKLEKERILWG